MLNIKDIEFSFDNQIIANADLDDETNLNDETNLDDETNLNDEIDINNPKHRHLIYLKLLENELKMFNYKKNNKYMVQNKNIMEYETKYRIVFFLGIPKIQNLKILLEKNIMDNIEIYDKDNTIKNFDDYHEQLEIVNTLKIQYLGFSNIDYIQDKYDDYNKLHTLGILTFRILFFKVIDDQNLTYIYYSNHNNKFYILKTLPKIEYIPNDIVELYIYNNYIMFCPDCPDYIPYMKKHIIYSNNYFICEFNYMIVIFIVNIETHYTKNIFIKKALIN